MNKIETYSMSYLKFDENSNSMNYQYEFIELKDNSILYSITLLSLLVFILATGVTPIVLSILFTPYYAFLFFAVFPLLSIGYFIAESIDDKHFYKQSHIIKEIANFRTNIEALAAIEEAKCKEWRDNHPLEEKVRLAMEKNPNYVADLIRYVKFDLEK